MEQKQARLIQMKHADHHTLLPSQIVAASSDYRSKAFLIRYCEEEVEINESVLFRAEIPMTSQNYLDTEFCLECSLHFSDLSNLNGPESWQQHAHEF